MREVKRSALIAEAPSRMFQLINDIEKYPQFVPGCQAAHVVSRKGNEVTCYYECSDCGHRWFTGWKVA